MGDPAGLKRALVVGGGINGLSSAWFLLKDGWSVTIIERDLPGEGCSFGNGGMIVPSHFVPLANRDMLRLGLKSLFNPAAPFGVRNSCDPNFLRWSMRYVRAALSSKSFDDRHALLRDLNLHSKQVYLQIAQELGLADQIFPHGMLMVGRTEEGLRHEKEFGEEASKFGLGVEFLTQEQLASAEPNVRWNAAGAVKFLDDAHLDPGVWMRTLQQRCIRHGAEWVRASVTHITNDAVTCDDGSQFPFDVAIVAVGAWTPNLARAMGHRIPMVAGKGYGALIEDAPSMRSCAILVEDRVAITPMAGGIRFVGTLEIGPKKRDVNARRYGAFVRSIKQCLPDFAESAFPARPWVGFRPLTPDGMPYIGRTNLPNVILNTGHAMMGMSLGPISGKFTAELAAGRPTSLPTSLLNPNRYD